MCRVPDGVERNTVETLTRREKQEESGKGEGVGAATHEDDEMKGSGLGGTGGEDDGKTVKETRGCTEDNGNNDNVSADSVTTGDVKDGSVVV